MKYCQGNRCHEYRTKDRIRGTKGNKSYQTRRRSSFYYGKNNFCSLRCQVDWINKHIENGIYIITLNNDISSFSKKIQITSSN